jgi:pre-mRNA cleavage complex 2 protein Pcf11
LYDIVTSRLQSANHDKVLPVIYVLDSILKNAKGCYVTMVERDAVNWMPTVYSRLARVPSNQQKLQKVWRTWNEPFHLFDAEAWRAMGRCFTDSTSGSSNSNITGSTNFITSTSGSSGAVAGIARTSQGSLILSKSLRQEMQNILDDMQDSIATTELDKVSLERLADVDPDLLFKIKQAAEDALNSSLSSSQPTAGHAQPSSQSQLIQKSMPSFLSDPRSDYLRQRAGEWKSNSSTTREGLTSAVSDSILPSLQHLVTTATAADDFSVLYTQSEALQMTQYLAAAMTTMRLLTSTAEQITTTRYAAPQAAASTTSTSTSALFAVDPKQFNNDGIKQRNAAAVGWLYDLGLPFRSAVDGCRFRTQLDLSQHLDALFRRKQEAKQSVAATAERGWYLYDLVWTREETRSQQIDTILEGDMDYEDSDAGKSNIIMESIFPADETRDRCVICGIQFQMFSGDDGEYKYRNCREIEVLNDDAAATESDLQLVHGTCWTGLGGPDTLTADQTLRDLLVHPGS